MSDTFFTGNLLHEIFNYDLPQADAILAAAEQAFQMNMVKIQNEQFLIYSTREGLLQFAKTGLTDEIPEIFYHPLTVEQRIEILNGVRQCCETGVYRFLQAICPTTFTSVFAELWEVWFSEITPGRSLY